MATGEETSTLTLTCESYAAWSPIIQPKCIRKLICCFFYYLLIFISFFNRSIVISYFSRELISLSCFSRELHYRPVQGVQRPQGNVRLGSGEYHIRTPSQVGCRPSGLASSELRSHYWYLLVVTLFNVRHHHSQAICRKSFPFPDIGVPATAGVSWTQGPLRSFPHARLARPGALIGWQSARVNSSQ